MGTEVVRFNDLRGKTGSVRVAVVAAGVISPLGFGLDETLASLRANKDCVSPVTRFDVEKCRCKAAGQISGGAHWRLARYLRTGLCRIRFFTISDTGKMSSVRSRPRRNGSRRRRGGTRA